MRLGPVLMDQPCQHPAGAVCHVRNQSFRPKVKTIAHAIDHGPFGMGLGCSNRSAGFHAHNDRVVGVDEIVVEYAKNAGPWCSENALN